MENLEFSSFLLPSQLGGVPHTSGGIYQFLLRFPSDFELGLRSVAPNLPRAAQVIARYIQRASAALSMSPLSGSISSARSALHLRTSYEVQCSRNDLLRVNELTVDVLARHQISLQELKQVAAALRLAFSAAPALYVGMAAKQSLQTRLKQHLNSQTAVSRAMDELGLSWRDLEYRCVALDESAMGAIRDLEQLVQAIFKPALSER